MRRSRSSGIVAGAGMCALVLSPAALAQTAVAIDLPELPLEEALDRFAVQARISLSLPPDGFGSLRSPAIRGSFSPEEGLRRLLAGSHFHAEPAGQMGYRIVANPPPIPEAPAARPENADRVVVSARRHVAVEDVPRDVVQISGDDLVGLRLASDNDLALSVSGLSFTNVGAGRDKIFLRGLSDGAFAGRTQSLTGIYFGDTRITYGAPDPDLRLTDVEAVEVLKGPQGALYGSGSLGGIVHIEPTRADLHDAEGALQVSAETTRGGAVSNSIDVVLNQPLIQDVMGARAVLYDERVGGWLDNAGVGLNDANKSHRRGGRLDLLAQLGDDWSVELSGAEQETSTRDSQYLVDGPAGLLRESAVPEPHDNDFSTAAFTIRGSWGRADLTSATSIVRHRLANRFQATGALLDLPPVPGATQVLDEDDNLSMLLNETRLVSQADAPIQWFAGVFYADGDNERTRNLVDLGSSGSLASRYAETRSDLVDELAIFGEVTWPLAEQLSLSTGLRLFRSSLEVRSVSATADLLLAGPLADKVSESGAAPDVRLAYRPYRDLLLYVSAAEGYRGAGVNSGGLAATPANGPVQPFARYKSDEIWTYELGMRGEAFDKTLEFSGAVFRSDWKNVQSDALFSRGFSYAGNVGDARVYGFEIDARYWPLDNLKFDLHALLSEPELIHADPSFPSARAGGLPGSSEYSASLSARYAWDFDLLDRPARAFAQAGLAYVGPANLGFGFDERVGDYLEGDLRVGVDFGPWRALVYVLNAADSAGSTFAIGNPYRPADSLVTPLRPRTIGVSLGYDF